MNVLNIAKAATFTIVLLALVVAIRQGVDFWSTPDQRGQRLLRAGDEKRAAETFSDPFRRAAALVQQRDYKSAAAVYAGLPGPDAAFNHGNALLMQGEYETAMERYDRALKLRPEWPEAIENRELARLRGENMKDQPGIGTDGELGADEIVFDLDSNKNAKAGEEQTDGGEASDEELRQVWLRQVQTTPRDFLKSKFAYQEAMRARKKSDEPDLKDEPQP